MHVRTVMDAAWQTHARYTRPNVDVYPWMWLWDSCFHSIIWTHLGDDRAIAELETIFRAQTASGFVPHMAFPSEAGTSGDLWGPAGISPITQPPMYGHALRVAVDSGIDVGDHLLEAATRGIDHLIDQRRRADGLLVVVHPWETGCDDSARWGSWMTEPFSKSAWDRTKRKLLASIELVDGAGVANPEFEVASAAFNALVSFNARDLAAVTGDQHLAVFADELDDLLAARWRHDELTWPDGPHPSATAPTLEGLLPLLGPTTNRELELVEPLLTDPSHYGGVFGLRQTSRSYRLYDPDQYWRGPVWPQLDYLIVTALRRHRRHELGDRLAANTQRGALCSGFAEYWNGETGAGRGAIPQSWTMLAWVLRSSTRG